MMLGALEGLTADETYDALMQTLVDALMAKAKGEPIDSDAAYESATLLAGAQLVRSGLSIESVERLFTEREYDVRLAYSTAGGLEIDLRWLDENGEPLADQSPRPS